MRPPHTEGVGGETNSAGRRHGQQQNVASLPRAHEAHCWQKADPSTASLVHDTATGEHRHAHNEAAARGARGPERAPPRRRCQLEECGPKKGSTGDETVGEETATRSPPGPSRTSGEREEGAAEDGGEDGAAEDGGEDGGDTAGDGAGGAAADRTDSHCAR